VFNYGSISGRSNALNAYGVFVTTGAIINGAPNDTTATITGDTGVVMQQSNNLTNYGHITGTAGYGASMPGNIVNGSTADVTASIVSNTNDAIAGASNVTNYGLIKGTVGINTNGSVVVTNYGTIAGTAGLNPAIQLAGTGATINNFGTIENSVGATGLAILDRLGMNSLTNAAGASIIGNIAGKVGTVTNNGTITLNGGAGWGGLSVTGAIDPSSSGVFQLATQTSGGAGALEVAAALGTNVKIQFMGPAAHRNRLTIDDASKFGQNVGSTSYAGPLLEGFSAGDGIDLKNVPVSGLGWSITPVDATTENLQLTSGGKNVATLQFQTSSLGAGTFHLQSDGYGFAFLTHS
jgi:hypothetical protein